MTCIRLSSPDFTWQAAGTERRLTVEHIWSGRPIVSGIAAKKEKSMESMRASIIAKLAMIVKAKPADRKPQIISTGAVSELIDRVEEKVPGWVKKTAHLDKLRTFQSALQQARNHVIDVSSLTSEDVKGKTKLKIKRRRGRRRNMKNGRSFK